MNEQRPTPETDAACFRADYYNAGQQTPVVHADFARNLERERDEARERAESKNGLWVSELSRVTELEKQIQTMLKHDATRLESDSLVGSCDCQTKTPETKYHKPGCKYRLIYERDEARERERVAVAWWDEERLRRQRETISLQQQLEGMREALTKLQPLVKP